MFRVGSPALQIFQYLSQQGLGGPITSLLAAVKINGATRFIDAIKAMDWFSDRFMDVLFSVMVEQG